MSSISKLRIAAAAAVVFATAMPTIASAETTVVPKARAEKAGATVDAEKRQYCANMRVGTSRMNANVCKTKAQWAAKGIAVADPASDAQVASAKN